MDVAAPSFCLAKPFLTLQAGAGAGGAAATLPENSRLRFCQEQTTIQRGRKQAPLFHLPPGLLTTPLNHLQKAGSQGQKYQYNLQSLKRKDYLAKCQGGKRAFQPFQELVIILAPRPFVMMPHFLPMPYNFSIIHWHCSC